MKQIKHLWLACLFILLTASQCKKDKDPLSKLPPETQTGANTFGCLVNGEAWIPKGTDYGSGTNVTAYYQRIYPSLVGYVFVLNAHDYRSDHRSSFSIGWDSLKVNQGDIIKLTSGEPGFGGATFQTRNNVQATFNTNQIQTGEILFKRFDEISQIASGTFWFDALNENGDIVHVTEGRFDAKFTR